MAKTHEETTNAMRMLRTAGVPFSTRSYEVDESDLSGVHAAEVLGLDPAQMFKTLVAHGEKRGFLLFVIPVAEELDLKKCAVAAGDKRVELIPVRDLLPLTGYLRGGCSPVGMKKQFPTFFDETASLFETIFVSAGKRGLQLEVDSQQLCAFLGSGFYDLTV